jgi:hypothetical protein
MQNKAIFYFHFDIFIFENKVAAMECPVFLSIVMFKLSVQDNHKSFYNYYCKIFIQCTDPFMKMALRVNNCKSFYDCPGHSA